MQEWHIDIDDASTCSFTFSIEQKNREYNDDQQTAKKNKKREKKKDFFSLSVSSFFLMAYLDNDWFTLVAERFLSPIVQHFLIRTANERERGEEEED